LSARSLQSLSRDILAAAAPDVGVAYAAFLVLALLPSLIADGAGLDARVTLSDLLSGHVPPAEASGGGGGGVLLVLVTAATVVVPYLWKHRLAALAAVLPLVVTLWGLWPLHRQHQAEQEAIDALTEFGLDPELLVRQVDAGASGLLGHLSVCAWMLFAVVTYLAIRGVMRALVPAAPKASASSAS
jgi:hypothetical protein